MNMDNTINVVVYFLLTFIAITLLNAMMFRVVTRDQDKLGYIVGIIWVIGIYGLFIMLIMETI